MEYFVVLPDETEVLPAPMKKFVFVHDDYMVAVLIQDNFSEVKLKQNLDLPEEDLSEIIEIIKANYSEEEIGETKLSEVTKLAEVKRILPSQD